MSMSRAAARAFASRIVMRLIEQGAIHEDDQARLAFIAIVADELQEIFAAGPERREP